MSDFQKIYMLNESLLDDVDVDEVVDSTDDKYGEERIRVELALEAQRYYLKNETLKNVKQFLRTQFGYGIIEDMKVDTYVNYNANNSKDTSEIIVWFNASNFTLDVFSSFLVKVFRIIADEQAYCSLVVKKVGKQVFEKDFTISRVSFGSTFQMRISDLEPYKLIFPNFSNKTIIFDIVRTAIQCKLLMALDKEARLYRLWLDKGNDESSCLMVRADGTILFELEQSYFTDSEVFHSGCLKIFEKGKGYNYIDREGNYLSNGVYYSEARGFNEYGLAIVKANDSDGGYSIMDTSGNFITKEEYATISDFKDNGRTVVSKIIDGSYKYNLIDTNGNLLLKDWVGYCNISDDYCKVKDGNTKKMFDINGKFLFDYTHYVDMAYANDGYWLVLRKEDRRWNIIDRGGNLLLDEWYDNIRGFYYGFAIVSKRGSGDTFIDETGNFICKDKRRKPIWFEECSVFDEEGNAIVVNKEDNRLVNFIDINGKFLSDEWFLNYNNRMNIDCMFKNGFAGIYKKDEYGDIKSNFIDRKGNILVDGWFERIVKCFDESGYAVIYQNNRNKIVDKTGKIIEIKTRRELSNIGKFENGVALVTDSNNKENYIKSDGSLVSREWFYRTGAFVGNVCKVYKHERTSNGGSGSEVENYMDINGNLMFDEWTDYRIYSDNEVDDVVILKNKRDCEYNMITSEGKFLFEKWILDVIDCVGPKIYRIGFGKSYVDNEGNYVNII